MKARRAPEPTTGSPVKKGPSGPTHPLWGPSNAMVAGAVDRATRAPSLLAMASGALAQGDTEASQTSSHPGIAERGPVDTVTTGRPAPGQNVTSIPLAPGGQFTTADFLPHHADRANSWAARQIHDEHNPVGVVNAFDFTFTESTGDHLGVPLIAPGDVIIDEVQDNYEESGGYGKYITITFTDGEMAGQTLRVHHLDTVNGYEPGTVIPGGTVIGTQGNSGSERFSYSDAYSHVDLVGTPEAAEYFVRSNQTGEYDSNIAGERDTFAPMQIRQGGSNVQAMQQLLVDQGLLETADGDFGSMTKGAVEAFQSSSGLPVTGFVDRATWDAMQPAEPATPARPPGVPAPPKISFVG